MRETLLAFVLAVTLPLPVSAGGFLIYEHGAPATGMADARTASSDDLSALYFNPAAITELPGLQLTLGVTGFLPYVSYQAAKRPADRTYFGRDADGAPVQLPVNDGQNDADAKLKGFTPFHLYASYNVEELGIAAGLGVNNPFGLGTYWPGDWDGRFITTESELQTFFVQPVLALDLAKILGFKDTLKLSLAAGYDVVLGTARLANRIDLRIGEALYADVKDPEGEVRLSAEAVGHGFNFALYAELPEIVAFGLSWRSGVALPFSGTAKFWFNPDAQQVRERLLTDIPDQAGAAVTLDMPMQLNVGVAYLGLPGFRLAADFFFAFYSTFDELNVTFDCLEDGASAPCPSLAQDPMVKDYHLSWQWSLGVESTLLDPVVLRAGFAMSFSPVPDSTLSPDLPDGTQKNACVGAGYRGDGWKLDLGYMLGFWSVEKNNDVGTSDATGNPNGKANGTYTTLAHILALSVSAWF